MPAPTDPNRQELIDALPASGTMTYEALRLKLLASGNTKAISRFHDMRRDGGVKTSWEVIDGKRTLMVSRA